MKTLPSLKRSKNLLHSSIDIQMFSKHFSSLLRRGKQSPSKLIDFLSCRLCPQGKLSCKLTEDFAVISPEQSSRGAYFFTEMKDRRSLRVTVPVSWPQFNPAIRPWSAPILWDSAWVDLQRNQFDEQQCCIYNLLSVESPLSFNWLVRRELFYWFMW